ncbi:MAG: J domain-containing protein [Candidatus Komeilibacteria bacterium]
MSTYYEILGVNHTASSKEIKQAFRRKAHKCHPDKPDGSDEKFRILNEAYQTLFDNAKRKAYDEMLHTSSASKGRRVKEERKEKEGRDKTSWQHGSPNKEHGSSGKQRRAKSWHEPEVDTNQKVNLPHGREYCHECNGFGFNMVAGNVHFGCMRCESTGLEPI